MPSRKALIVGVSQYAPETELSNLSAPVRDAQVIYEMLRQYGNFDLPPILLHEGQDKHGFWMEGVVNTNDLEKALDNLFTQEEAEAVDLAVFYFSGHGTYDDKTRQAFLATTDDAQAITLRNLLDRVENSNIQNVCIWLDACHSGGVLDFKELRGKNYCIVAAASKFGSALAPHGGNSFLTELLCQALKPCETSRPEVTTFELVRYLKQHRRDLPPLQHVLFVHGEHYFPLTFCDHPLPESDRISPDECPFKGLEAFTQNDAKYFFGRKRIIQQYLDRLEQEGGKRLVPIIGASGSGKSSLVLAGIIPNLLETDWEVRIIQPAGGCPLQNLQDVLGTTTDGTHDATTVQQAILQQIPEDKKFLLVIDQFEQVFTQCSNEIEKVAFRHLLNIVLQANNPFYLILTLRWDFLEDFRQYANDTHPDLREYLRRIELLPSLDSDELYETITEPLKLVGMTIEGSLVNELSAKSLGEKGSLPLLQYTLNELWIEAKRKGNNALTWDLYQQLGGEQVGGLRGILNKKANEFYESLSEKQKPLLEWLIVRLTQQGEDSGTPTRRNLTVQELIDDQPEYKDEIRILIEQLVSEEYRLLTKGSTLDAKPTVTLAHEALIRDWQLLGTWLQNNRETINLCERIKDDIIDWKKNKGSLLRDGRLAEAQEILNRYPKTLLIGYQERNFIQASIEQAQHDLLNNKKRQHRTIASLVGFIIFLLVSIGIIWYFSEKSQHAALEANRNLVKVLEEKSLFSFQEGYKNNNSLLLRKSILYALKAKKYLPNKESTLSPYLLGNLANIKEQDLSMERQKFPSFYLGVVQSIAYSPDGKIIATGVSTDQENNIKLWDAKSGQLINNLQGHNLSVTTVAYNNTGKLIASGSVDKTIRIWDSQSGQSLRTLQGHTAEITSIAFSHDGKFIASASVDKTIRLWDVETGQTSKIISKHTNVVKSITYSHDSRLIASGSSDNTVRIWNGKTGNLLKILYGHTYEVNSVVFSHDYQYIASGSSDGTIKIWDTTTGQSLKTLKGDGDSIISIIYSPNGKNIVAGTYKGKIKIWDIQNGILLKNIQAHFTKINSLAYSPNGRVLTTSSHDSIKFWDEKNITLISPLGGHNSYITSVVYSPDGKVIASGSGDHTLKLWDAQSGKLLRTMQSDKKITSVVYSPDGKLIASGSTGYTTQLWEALSGKLLKTLEAPTTSDVFENNIQSVAFSPDGNILAVASTNRTVCLWDYSKSNLLKTLSIDKEAYSIAFSRDGKNILIGSDNIQLWNIQNSQLINTFQGHADPSSLSTIPNSLLAISSDNKIIASRLNGNNVALWSYENGQLLRILQGHTKIVTSVAFSSDDKIVVSGSDDNTIRIWDIQTGQPIKIIKNSDQTRSVTISPDGKTIASGSRDNSIRLWDTKIENPPLTLKSIGYVHTVAFSPDGNILATGEMAGGLALWNASNGHLLKRLHDNDRGVYVFDLTFSPDGKFIASASDNGLVYLWDKNKGQVIKILKGHTSGVFTVDYSPDGKFIITGSGDNTIKEWDANNGSLLKTLQHHQGGIYVITYSPDGKVIASGSEDNNIILWDVTNGKPMKIIQGHTGPIRSLSYSPNGKVVASGSDDGKVKLWNSKNGQLIQTLTDHPGSVYSIAYHPNGEIIATGSTDSSVRLWNANNGQLLKVIQGCTNDVRSLSYSPDGKIIACGSGSSGSLSGVIHLQPLDNKIVHLISDFDPEDVSDALCFLWEMELDGAQVHERPHPPALFPQKGYYITFNEKTNKLRPLLNNPLSTETKLEQIISFLNKTRSSKKLY